MSTTNFSFSLKDTAKKATAGCELMADREKITREDLKKYDCITICGVDMIQSDGKMVPVLIFKEDSKKFFFGGKAFSDILDAWLAAADGDLSAVQAALAADPIAVKLVSTKTKTGRDFTRVEVL